MRLLAALIALAAAAPAIAIDAGEAVPPITIARLDEASAPLSLGSLRGQVVYVDFWASWCVPCRQSMPALDALYRSRQARGFTVIGINQDVSRTDAERFLKRVAVSFPLVRADDDAPAKAFDVRAMPSGYLVDRRGMVRFVHRGFTPETAAVLEKQVDDLLREGS